MSETRQEVIPVGRVIWQSALAKTYQCPRCQTWLDSQYEGEASPTVICNGPLADHVLLWSDGDV